MSVVRLACPMRDAATAAAEVVFDRPLAEGVGRPHEIAAPQRRVAGGRPLMLRTFVAEDRYGRYAFVCVLGANDPTSDVVAVICRATLELVRDTERTLAETIIERDVPSVLW